MAIYFTHLSKHTGFDRDEEGREFASDDAAVHDAARAAGSVLTDDLWAGRMPVAIEIMIEREDGSAVATVEVSAKIDRPS